MRVGGDGESLHGEDHELRPTGEEATKGVGTGLTISWVAKKAGKSHGPPHWWELQSGAVEGAPELDWAGNQSFVCGLRLGRTCCSQEEEAGLAGESMLAAPGRVPNLA